MTNQADDIGRLGCVRVAWCDSLYEGKETAGRVLTFVPSCGQS